MNFLYTILFFAVTACSLLTVSLNTTGNVSHGFLVIASIAFVATFIVVMVTFFRNLYFRQVMKELFNELRTDVRRKKIEEEEFESYKKEVENSLTKLYPDYEKELFKGMTPGDAEHLNAVLVKYPELKFNGVLEKYTGKISNFLDEIGKKDREIEHTLNRIRDLNDNDWMFIVVSKPGFVIKMLAANEMEA